MDIKQKIQTLLDQQHDPRILAEVYETVHRIFSRRMLSNGELKSSSVRYKNVLADKEREQWALEWLTGSRNP